MKNHTDEDLIKEIQDHQRLCDFIKNKQAQEAKNVMSQHLKNAENLLKEFNEPSE